MSQLLLVMAGGALGSGVRYLTTIWAATLLPDYRAVGTLIVNVVGCLLIGGLVGAAVEHRWMTAEWRAFLVSGVLGGLTTFSSLALEVSLLSRWEQGIWPGVGHLLANLLLGFVAVIVGEQVARWSLM